MVVAFSGSWRWLLVFCFRIQSYLQHFWWPEVERVGRLVLHNMVFISSYSCTPVISVGMKTICISGCRTGLRSDRWNCCRNNRSFWSRFVWCYWRQQHRRSSISPRQHHQSLSRQSRNYQVPLRCDRLCNNEAKRYLLLNLRFDQSDVYDCNILLAVCLILRSKTFPWVFLKQRFLLTLWIHSQKQAKPNANPRFWWCFALFTFAIHFS